MSNNSYFLAVIEEFNAETNTWAPIPVESTSYRFATLAYIDRDTGERYIRPNSGTNWGYEIPQPYRIWLDDMSVNDALTSHNQDYFETPHMRHHLTGKPLYFGKPGQYRWARYKDKEWRQRERNRLEDGTYNPLPTAWAHLPAIRDHYAHVSKDGQSIAFTSDENKGMIDIQTVMKPGRYLTRFYPELSGDEVRDLAAKVGDAFVVHFAETQEDIIKVYLNGPNSCMSKPLSCYESAIHPVAVYAAGDLQLAYMSRNGKPVTYDGFERATDRALVWPDKKIYGRIYGGGDNRMARALQAMGYREAMLTGARLLKIAHEEGESYIMPYIDGECSVSDHGDHFRIGGAINADSTSGVIRLYQGVYCSYTEEYHDEEDMIYINDVNEYWHNSCLDNGDAFHCYGSGEYYSTRNSDYVTTDNGETYELDYFERRGGYHCNGRMEYIIPNRWDGNTQSITCEDDGETYSRGYAEDNDFYHHEATGLWYTDRDACPDLETEDAETATDDAAVAA